MAMKNRARMGRTRRKVLRFEQLEQRAMLAWTVYQHTDNGTGSIGGTLSRAILDANSRAVNFPNEVQHIRFQFNDVNHDDPYVSISGTLPIITAPNTTIDGTDLQLTTADNRVVLLGSSVANTITSLRYDGSSTATSGEFIVQDLRCDTIEGDAIRIIGLGTNDQVTIDNVDVERSSPALDINGQPTLGSGSGVYFAATPFGSLGKFKITNSYFYRNADAGIVIDSVQTPTAATATSEISVNIIGYDSGLLTTSGNGTNSAGIRLGSGASKIDILSNWTFAK